MYNISAILFNFIFDRRETSLQPISLKLDNSHQNNVDGFWIELYLLTKMTGAGGVEWQPRLKDWLSELESIVLAVSWNILARKVRVWSSSVIAYIPKEQNIIMLLSMMHLVCLFQFIVSDITCMVQHVGNKLLWSCRGAAAPVSCSPFSLHFTLYFSFPAGLGIG